MHNYPYWYFFFCAQLINWFVVQYSEAWVTENSNTPLKGTVQQNLMCQECYKSIGFPLTLGHWYFVLNLKGIFSLNCKNRFQHINTKSLTYSASWGAFCKLTVAVRVSPLQGFCQYQWTLFHRRIHSWCGHICVGFYSQRYANFRYFQQREAYCRYK